jgi:hypothetical protein
VAPEHLFHLDHGQLPVTHPDLPKRPCRLWRTVVDDPVV